MSKDIKKEIEKIEEENTTKNELKRQVDLLNEENIGLKSIIEEQNVLIEQQDKIDSNIPPDVQLLKDMIIKKRQEMEEKEHVIETLNREILSLKNQMESSEKTEITSIDSEELENAKALILQLTEENKLYTLNEENSKKIVKNLMEKNDNFLQEIEELRKKKQAPNAENETISKVSEENRQIKREMESLKTKLESYETESTQMTQLIEENQGYKTQISQLKDRVQMLESSLTNSNSIEVQDLFKEILSLKNENVELKKKVFLLKKKEEKFKEQEITPEIIAHEPFKKEYGEITTESVEEKIGMIEEATIKPSEILAQQKTLSQTDSESIMEKPLEVEGIAQDIEKKPELEIQGIIEEESPVPIPTFETKLEMMVISDVEGHRKCPKCGNTNRNKIHEELDKSNIIMAYPRMYGKKYRCGQCGQEWRLRTD